MGLFKIVVIIALAPVVLYLWPSQLGGDTDFVIVRGVSMLPTIEGGSIAISKQSLGYDVGDIAVYVDDEGRTIIHRIVSIEDGGFKFKGDNNSYLDRGIIKQEEIVGKVIFVGPYMGYGVILLQNPVVMAILMIAFALKPSKKKKKSNSSGFPLFPVAIGANAMTYILNQLSIYSGEKPLTDVISSYLFKIFEPFFASTVSFAIWFFMILGVYMLAKSEESKELERASDASKLKFSMKEFGSMRSMAELALMFLISMQMIPLLMEVRKFLPSQ